MLLVSITINAQEINLDKYQYIIVASKFDFLKKTDQYQTSSLTKFLLEKKGFKVYLENENYPKEIIENRCLALFASVTNESNMLRTKNRIQLKDCYGNLVYQSKIGSSKIKEYKKAYPKAIRNAYETMEDFEYSFKPLSVIDAKNDKSISRIQDTLASVLTKQSKKVKETSKKVLSELNVLYAQTTENGFQLVNTKPEVVFIILKTSIKDVYILKDKNGTLYKSGTNWVAEYYENNKIVQKTYQVKF